MNLVELLNSSAQRWPDKSAIIDDGAATSYAALVENIRTLAERLRSSGVKPGSRVGVSCPNSVSYIAITFALWEIGAIAVPIPTECAAEEITDIVAALGLAAIVSRQPRGRALP